jgi:hypothetical protein
VRTVVFRCGAAAISCIAEALSASEITGKACPAAQADNNSPVATGTAARHGPLIAHLPRHKKNHRPGARHQRVAKIFHGSPSLK